jgi:phytoene dehydrogenase-like protein
LRAAANTPLTGWGAFVLYLGVDGDALAGQGAGHHQIILRKPMGEGNTAFLSISPDWDLARAPSGSRAVTMSTHTRMAPWWELFHADREAYEARKESYTERLLSAADRIYPRLKDAVDLALPGTPVSFRRHTGRERGWVGGFPQTSLFKGLPSRLREDVWLVGDSIFPGQSTAAVALGGMRVAEGIQITGGAAKWGDPHPIVDGTMHSVENLERECAMPGDGAEV